MNSIQNTSADRFYNHMIPLYSKYVLSRAIYVITKLKMAELLEHGPLYPHQIADKLGCHLGNLLRVIQLVQSRGIFRNNSDGRVEHSSLSLLLCRNVMGDDIIADQDRNWKKLKTPGKEFSEVLQVDQGDSENPLWAMARGYLLSRAVYGSVVLGIQNVCQEGDPYRLHLERAGLLQGNRLTPEGELLLDPGCQEFFKHEIEERWIAMENLEVGIRTGKVPFEHIYGTSFFKYLQQHPEKTTNFDKAMTFITDCELATLKSNIQREFAAGMSIVDVGGGNGKFLARLMEDQLDVQGILFDLPQTVANHEIPKELQARCECVGGSFFEEIPSADLYLIKRILHDWSDAECIQILSNCRKSMKKGAKLILNEFVLPHPIALGIDVVIMSIMSGRERSEEEFRKICTAAGWEIQKITPAACGISTIVAV